ncbi:complex I 51 kDa subunit family protein [Roseinatronobacter bogoriensis]|uniref:NADH-quinone oxidoreductase subunit F n=1 Tax=Roseinatronobacter bogoriensis subsp. barguzinensis TaxID=441209 RepID=A0A2K8K7F2_9RHOB|nr:MULTISPECIES: NADH-ubiquinone oxidoreductase-F iron-sulfur binding region domain-containing protein [Rhodobaca]ATX64846.1 NADH-quinone oxidoreductase subunit F [Rhodobaca barguzinensis]MBB4208639.1 NADH-quinone oxidoreductase subunit F [Rhodobaca bogoriensis DSM 18756]TDW38093.1 NADH dehydrogenase subunit F [Rhodobaca barguzinensis]TDY69737.1 NADH dehydrogenase subunit F [Rhodobaca bogoriensis DSM 18756]
MNEHKPLTGRARPDRSPHTLEEWRKLGGYAAVERGLKALSPEQVLDMVDDANLNGRGGAGFPAAKKWRFMPKPGQSPGDGPSYFIVNGDEMEPGAFKDRILLEAVPHQLIEGAILAAYATHSSEIIVLIRDAYRDAIANVTRAIAEAEAAGYLGRNVLGSGFDVKMWVHPSAGRYIVGEETALIEALEGKRAVPRKRPPFPAQSGLWGRPTTVNNVETVSCVSHIVANGAQWFRALSRTEEGGTKVFGVSGRVNRPGIIEAPMGTPAGELIEQAGGVSGTGVLRCFQPGGGASGFLEPDALDVPLDFGNVAKAGSMFGTGTMIVLDQSACPLAVIARHMAFYARESCGWCTPCRDGLPWVAQIMMRLERGEGRMEDLDVLRETVAIAGPRGRTFCDLMGGAMAPLGSGLARFGDLFEAHVREGCCPIAREYGRSAA